MDEWVYQPSGLHQQVFSRVRCSMSLLHHTKDTVILTSGPDWLWPCGPQSLAEGFGEWVCVCVWACRSAHVGMTHKGKSTKNICVENHQKVTLKCVCMCMWVCVRRGKRGPTVKYSQVSMAINMFIAPSHSHKHSRASVLTCAGGETVENHCEMLSGAIN